ncbi:MAG TPA: DedA family protein [Chthoniobacterales bacterium]|jgi:membrane protein DedA with SNARE-associated domain|nr:DedA family protein [Chthoniobacterales bacterium]
MHHLLEVWFQWVLDGGYWGIIALMAMESSVIPVPSEIVIPPAAFLASQGHLSFAGVILAGTLGSYIGAAISYWVSRWLGRAIILRFGKYFFIGPEKLERAEIWLERYEAGGVFFARLLPVIRHLISIPAGIVRMNFWIFSVATIAGSAIWCGVLAFLGDRAFRAQPDLISNPDGLVQLMKAQSHWIVLAILALAILYLLVLWLSARRPAR